ncbi:MAG: hypothetical protein JWP89_4056 [Schlesneria sp.]|nr:hypothetical protein [Schlesneria sp.]
MANFRAERLFIRVAGELDFDPNEGIDVKEFAFAMVCDGAAYDRPLCKTTRSRLLIRRGGFEHPKD